MSSTSCTMGAAVAGKASIQGVSIPTFWTPWPVHHGKSWVVSELVLQQAEGKSPKLRGNDTRAEAAPRDVVANLERIWPSWAAEPAKTRNEHAGVSGHGSYQLCSAPRGTSSGSHSWSGARLTHERTSAVVGALRELSSPFASQSAAGAIQRGFLISYEEREDGSPRKGLMQSGDSGYGAWRTMNRAKVWEGEKAKSVGRACNT